MYCSTSLFVKGYYKAQPLNVSLVVFPRAHELFNFAAQPPALVFLHIFIEYCIARGLLLSIFLGFSQQFFA